MTRKSKIKVDSLSRLLIYILGYRPYEFGLVPDEQGFLSYKELLWAIHEEPGWGYVREGHISEVLISKDRALFETKEKGVRVYDRRWRLDLETPAPVLPKILFVPVRRRAHPHALEKGLREGEGGRLVLSADPETAARIGRRRDRNPVILEVAADEAQREGLPFYAFGELFLTTEVPPRHILGPPLPKETVKAAEAEKEKRPKVQPGLDAGTFTLDPGRDPALHRRGKGKQGKGWKEDARKTRRRKGL